MRSRRRRQSGAADPDITPLLDVVFILLLFFVIAAAFTVRGMDLDLPPARSAHSVTGHVTELILDKDGRLMGDGVELNEQGLLALLDSLEHTGVEGGHTLLLKAHSDAPAGRLLFVIDTIRSHGGGRLVIASSPAKPLQEAGR